MNKILFISTHSFSNYEQIVDSINQSKKAQIYITYRQYNNYSDLEVFNKCYHKRMGDPHRIYGDVILNNVNFYYYDLCKHVKFVHFIARPEYVIPNLIKNNKMSPYNAVLHYSFRLRRICEIAYRCNDYLFFSYDDLFKPSYYDKINGFLNDQVGFISQYVNVPQMKGFPSDYLNYCFKIYERHYAYLKQF